MLREEITIIPRNGKEQSIPGFQRDKGMIQAAASLARNRVFEQSAALRSARCAVDAEIGGARMQLISAASRQETQIGRTHRFAFPWVQIMIHLRPGIF